MVEDKAIITVERTAGALRRRDSHAHDAPAVAPLAASAHQATHAASRVLRQASFQAGQGVVERGRAGPRADESRPVGLRQLRDDGPPVRLGPPLILERLCSGLNGVIFGAGEGHRVV